MKVTIEMIAALKPCFTAEKLAEAMKDGFDVGVRKVSRQDARWVLARLLTRENRVKWARNSAARAKEYAAKSAAPAVYAAYAAAAYADAAGAYADDAAPAASAAAFAYAALTATADADYEHELCVADALRLISEQPDA